MNNLKNRKGSDLSRMQNSMNRRARAQISWLPTQVQHQVIPPYPEKGYRGQVTSKLPTQKLWCTHMVTFPPFNQIKHKTGEEPLHPAGSRYVLRQHRQSFKRQKSSELQVPRSSKKEKELGKARERDLDDTAPWSQATIFNILRGHCSGFHRAAALGDLESRSHTVK